MSTLRLLLALLFLVPSALTLAGCPTADDDDTEGQDDDDSEDECEDLDGDGFCGEEDCDETDPNVYLGAEELCDGIDNDCDGEIEQVVDLDGDGYDTCSDCDDDEPNTWPGAEEICDGEDNDCDGVIIAEEQDVDGDGYLPCQNDCGPNDPNIYPGAEEICDLLDSDCDGVIPSAEIDDDGDNFTECPQGDCNDEDPWVFPGAVEYCNGQDDDCDPATVWTDSETGATEDNDADLDGFTVCEGDCDDSDPQVGPQGYDLVGGGVDGNCDGIVGQYGPDLEILSDSEANLVAALSVECGLHGRGVLHIDFESGTLYEPVSEVGFATTTVSDLGLFGAALYYDQDGDVAPFSGNQMARMDGPGMALWLNFVEPQTMIILSLGGYDENAANGYGVGLNWGSTELLFRPWFEGASVVPAGWSQRGFLSAANLAFDAFEIASDWPSDLLYIDDLYLCD